MSLVSFVTDIYDNLEESNRNIKELHRKLYAAWGVFKHRPEYEWQSKAFFPKCFEQEETIYSRLYNQEVAIIPRSRFYGEEDGIEKVEQLLKFQREIGKYRYQDAIALKHMLVIGTGLYQFGWAVKEKTRYEEKKDKEIITKYIQCEYPELKAINPLNFYIDPAYKSIQDAPCVVVRNIYSKKELERQGIYNLSGVTPISDENLTKLAPDEQKLLAKKDNFKTQYVELMEFWGVRDGKEVVIAIANRNKVVRNEENPFGFRPFVAAHCTDDPNHFWGKGVIEPTIGMQQEYNYLMNGVLDSLTMSLMGVIRKDPNSLLDNDDLRVAPNAVWTAYEGEIERMSFDISGLVGVHETIKTIAQDIKGTAGATDFSQGNSVPGFNDTASGIMLLVEQSNMRFDTIQENFKRCWVELAEYILELNKRYLDDVLIKSDKRVRNSDKKWYTPWKKKFVDYLEIKREDIGDYAIEIEIGKGGITNHQQRVATIEAIQNVAQMFPEQMDPQATAQRLLELNKVNNPEEIMAKEQAEQAMPENIAQEATGNTEQLLDQYGMQEDPMVKQKMLQEYDKAIEAVGQIGGPPAQPGQ